MAPLLLASDPFPDDTRTNFRPEYEGRSQRPAEAGIPSALARGGARVALLSRGSLMIFFTVEDTGAEKKIPAGKPDRETDLARDSQYNAALGV